MCLLAYVLMYFREFYFLQLFYLCVKHVNLNITILWMMIYAGYKGIHSGNCRNNCFWKRNIYCHPKEHQAL